MKRKTRIEIEDAIIQVLNALDSEKDTPALPRVGEAGTPLSISKVIDDEEKRTVVIVWEDGTKTKSTADPKDEYDFMTGFGLCIAKKLVYNLKDYSEVMKKSARYVHIEPKKKKKK